VSGGCGVTRPDAEIERLRRRLDRERRARREAEKIAESTTSTLYDRQRELELLEAVAAASNQAVTREEAVHVALERICVHLGWAAGHALMRDSVSGDLVSARRWYLADNGAFAGFRAASEETAFAPGVGLPGRVLASGVPMWIEDVAAEQGFPRMVVAAEEGVRGAFAFPVHEGEETAAVIEIFSSRPVAVDHGLLGVVGHIGTQVGRVFERARAQEELSHHALHDALCGLPNRALLVDRLELALARGRRSSSLTGVLFIDLDRFKDVNDGAGHHAGDEVLVEVARRLDEGIRGGDTIARMGGDEFVVLCEELSQEGEAVELAERLQRLVMRPFRIASGQEHLLTASIGIALCEAGASDPEAILRDADVAMYRAKDLGGARHELFNAALRERLTHRLRIERALVRALEDDELRLHYQPIVSLDGRRTEGVEALVRWEDPEKGLRSPAEFIPIAEQSSLILRVGSWVVDEACRQAAVWRADPATRHLLPVNINLAARQLGDERLPEIVRTAVEHAGLEPQDIALEITESALIENAEVPARTLAELRRLGIGLMLDDFGTGYSSLSYLHRFPVDVLKIDRSFIEDLAEGSPSSAIVGAIVGMGHSLGLRVVAEGIETEEQAAEAQRLGCDSAQGYLFARPAPAGVLEPALGFHAP
jgi:diguanylate cyclase (GGDEF)-like protein